MCNQRLRHDSMTTVVKQQCCSWHSRPPLWCPHGESMHTIMMPQASLFMQGSTISWR